MDMKLMAKIKDAAGRMIKKQGKIWVLAFYDLKSRYADSFLGFFWAFVLPLVTILCFWFVFEKGFRNPPARNGPYSYWFSAGYLPWLFFSDAIGTGCRSYLDYGFLLKKIPFQSALLPSARLTASFVVHLILLAGLLFYGVLLGKQSSIRMGGLCYYLSSALVLERALAELLAQLSIYWKDMISIVQAGLQILFWLTPVVWDESILMPGKTELLLLLNPAAYIVRGYRDCLSCGNEILRNTQDTKVFWGITLALAALALTASRKTAPYLADEV